MSEQEIFANYKISARQTERTLVLEMFGLSSLLLPGYLSAACGIWGIWPMLCGAGGAYALLFVWQKISRKQNIYARMKETGGAVQKLLSVSCGIIFVLLAGWVLTVLVQLIRRQLLQVGMDGWILLTLVLAAFYGLMRGIETRVRIYEVLFCFLLVPLLVMLGLAGVQVTPSNWLPDISLSVQSFLRETWRSFAFFSVASLLLLFYPWCARPVQTFRRLQRGFWLTVGLNLAVYLILLGIFQRGLLEQLKDPVITLMAVVKLPGEFFERQDAFMVAIWFFCLFALVSSFLFYGKDWLCRGILKGMVSGSDRYPGKKELWVIVGCTTALFAETGLFLRYQWMKDTFERVFLWGLFPVLLAVPILLSIWKRFRHMRDSGHSDKKTYKKKAVLSLGILFLLGTLCGCGTKELESSAFPLALGIAPDVQGVTMTVACPNLQASDADKNALASDLFWKGTGTNLFDAFAGISKENSKNMDLNHLKVLLLDPGMLEDNTQRTQLADFFLGTKEAAMNTYVLLMDGPEDAFFDGTLDIESSLGIYLEDMIEEWDEQKKSSYVTVADLLRQFYGSDEILFVPVLTRIADRPVVKQYAIFQKMQVLCRISRSKGEWLMLLAGGRKSLSFSHGQEQLKLEKIRVKKKSSEKGMQRMITVHAVIRRENGGSISDCRNLEQELSANLTSLVNTLQLPGEAQEHSTQIRVSLDPDTENER